MNNQRKITYGLLSLVVLGTVWFLGGDNPSPSAKITPVKKSYLASAANSLFTEADRKAHFEPISISNKNAFNALVKRTGSGGVTGEGKTSDPTTIPASFAGGETGWVFTGTAAVDGVALALFENNAKQDSTFVHQGDTWKGTLIASIMADGVVLEGSDGERITVHSKTEEAELKPTAPSAVSPVNTNPFSAFMNGANGMNGPINAVPGMNGAAATPGAMGGNQGGGRGGGRRGGRGMRGGNQGGGNQGGPADDNGGGN
ncbi:MAG: hypothetical protein JSS72_11525 [Armatimonadetes bacterium]|nr:hypothetical protein [Armatimonadota bacterium]